MASDILVGGVLSFGTSFGCRYGESDMLKKQVSVGRALLCVALCVIFTALTTYQFSYYYTFARYREDLAEKTAAMQANEYLLAQKEADIAQLRAILTESEERVSDLVSRLVKLTGSETGTAEDCLRLLVGGSLAKKHGATGVDREHLNEEVDAYMKTYASDFVAVAERLLFIDYLYRTHYLGDAPTAEDAQEAIVEAYMAAAGDVYAKYYTPEEYAAYRDHLNATLCGVGAATTITEDGSALLILHVHSKSPAKAAGLQKGDLILAVDGQTVASLGHEGALAAISGEADTSVTLEIARGGETLSYTITRAQVESDAVLYRAYTEGGKKIGYIRILSFGTATAAQLEAAYNDLKTKEGIEALVFDVRDNTGGLLSSIIEVLEFILPTGAPIAHYEFRNPYTQLEAEYAKDDRKIDLPMYVLQNGKTASAAELFCAALGRNGAALLVGETTYGKGRMQTGYRLNDGSYIAVTVAAYAPAAGEGYDGVGVEPNHRVTPDAGYENTLIYMLPEEHDAPLRYALTEAATYIHD